MTSMVVVPAVVTEAKVMVPAPPPGSVRETATLVPSPVFGGGGSTTVQVWRAAVSSVLPAASVATASTVCVPGSRSVRTSGELQPANAPPSTEHSNVSSVGRLWMSVPAIVMLAGVPSIVVAGPETVVSGAVRSGGSTTVHS